MKLINRFALLFFVLSLALVPNVMVAQHDYDRDDDGERAPQRLEILPSVVAVKAGDMVRFTVLAYTRHNTAYTPDRLKWDVEKDFGGRIDNEGQFYAGSNPGAYQIIVKSGRLRAIAQVEVKVIAPQIVRVLVNPPSAMLEMGQTADFQAVGYDRQNRPIPFTPVWSATGGLMSATGKFQATAQGQFTITARDPRTNLYGNAVVTVRTVPARVQITPPSAMMRAGQTAQFSAVAYDRFGRVIPCTFAWSASGGVVSQNGAYTAGYAPGNFQIVARDNGTGIQAAAVVQIIADVPVPPQPTNGRIVATSWDVGGGNFMTPSAKIALEVYGSSAQMVKLYAVSSSGAMNELQAFSCKDGQKLYFNTKYERFSTVALEIRLFDNMENVIAKTRRNVQ